MPPSLQGSSHRTPRCRNVPAAPAFPQTGCRRPQRLSRPVANIEGMSPSPTSEHPLVGPKKDSRLDQEIGAIAAVDNRPKKAPLLEIEPHRTVRSAYGPFIGHAGAPPTEEVA